jgi:DNA-binding IclR family transcriptional regulator
MTVDYAYGHSLQAEATKFVTANGGTIIGSALHPLSTQDFSSDLLKAQASGAELIALATPTPLIANIVKQAAEYRICQGGQRLSPVGLFSNDVKGIGLALAQDLLLAQQIAQQIAQNDPVLDQIGPVLAALRADTGETVILGKRQGQAITCLDVLESRRTIRDAAEPGDMKPLHSSAIGKAMLGLLAPTDLAATLRKLPRPTITLGTITDLDALTADIAEGRARGFFVTRGENVPDVMAIAISRSASEEFYGLAVAGPMSRIEAAQALIHDGLRTAGGALTRLDAAALA